MTLRTRLSALEKNVPPDDDLSHYTVAEVKEQLWQPFRLSKARHGEGITDAEEQLFRSEPERALVDSGRWTLEHWKGNDPDLKEEYRRLVETRAARLESRNYSEGVRMRIMREYAEFIAQKGAYPSNAIR